MLLSIYAFPVDHCHTPVKLLNMLQKGAVNIFITPIIIVLIYDELRTNSLNHCCYLWQISASLLDIRSCGHMYWYLHLKSLPASITLIDWAKSPVFQCYRHFDSYGNNQIIRECAKVHLFWLEPRVNNFLKYQIMYGQAFNVLYKS